MVAAGDRGDRQSLGRGSAAPVTFRQQSYKSLMATWAAL
jgi:hypothetical protein